MFREVARVKQKLETQECIGILKREKRGVLSVLGDDGYPYGMPMNHYYCEEDGKLYFHSGKKGHKIDAMHECRKASFCVYGEGKPVEGSWALRFRSVVVFGRIEFVEDTEKIFEITRRLSHKFTEDDAYIEEEILRSGPGTLMFALVPEHITGKTVTES
ncbi:MAG: pyridoxamine 5'-phosphate oxidase family protein [Blautia sp.]|nr:pyridoxamine 5'-phosphate oxidase family protein [Blautia sp.]